MKKLLGKKKSRYILIAALCLMLVLGMSGCSKEPEFTPDYANYNTYVFFGIDSRANDDSWKTGDDETGTQEGGPSSDVIMLVKADQETGDVKVVSVYRDTLMDVSEEDIELDKCNSAYRNYGEYGAIAMLEENLDTKISGFVTANFKTVADCIDALGGIEVDVEREPLLDGFKDKGSDSIDIINKYIDEMNGVYGVDTPHLTEGGTQTLSGIQAVAYSRLRYTEGGDLRRAERQREVMMKMMNKLKASENDAQHEVLKKMYGEVNTDLSESELIDLFALLESFDMDDTEGFPYFKRSLWANDDYYLIPCDLSYNVTELHKRLYEEEEYVPNDGIKDISKQIEEYSGFTAEDANKDWNDAY